MRPSVLVSVGIALALAGCNAPTTPMEAHELSVAARQVASLAGEAEWLAQQLRERSVSTDMAWVHQQVLGEDAAKVAHQLARPVPPNLRPTYEAVAASNTRLQTQVNRIASAADRPQELEALQRDFHALVGQMRPIGQAAT